MIYKSSYFQLKNNEKSFFDIFSSICNLNTRKNSVGLLQFVQNSKLCKYMTHEKNDNNWFLIWTNYINMSGLNCSFFPKKSYTQG